MKNAQATATRSAGGCAITPLSKGKLGVSCNGGDQATLTYAFPLAKGVTIKGTPWCSANWSGVADVRHSWDVVNHTLIVTVTVANGSATLSTVNVGYYT